MFIMGSGVLLFMSNDRARFVSGGKPAENGVSWGGSSGWPGANENGRIKVANGNIVALPVTPLGEVYRPMEVVQTRSVGSSTSEIICELHGASGDDGGNVGGYGLGGSAGDGAGSMALVADGVVVAEVGGGGGGGTPRRSSGDPSYSGGDGGRGGFAKFSLDLSEIDTLQLYVTDQGGEWGYSMGENPAYEGNDYDGEDGGRGGGSFVSRAAGGNGPYRADAEDGGDGRVYITSPATAIQSIRGGSEGDGKIILGFE